MGQVLVGWLGVIDMLRTSLLQTVGRSNWQPRKRRGARLGSGGWSHSRLARFPAQDQGQIAIGSNRTDFGRRSAKVDFVDYCDARAGAAKPVSSPEEDGVAVGGAVFAAR